MSEQSEPTISLSLPRLGGLLRGVWLWTRRIVLAVLVVTFFVLVLEAIHLHQLLASIHPALAWSVSGALLLGVLGLLSWIAWRWTRVPRAITPPDLPEPEKGWSAAERQAYLRFCARYLARQENNEHLAEESRARIPDLVERLESPDLPTDPAALTKLIEDEIDAILEPLDVQGRNEVWQCATQVAVLTAVNPSSLLDVLITFLRNLELMARLAELYYGRPGVLGTLRVARDVLAVAATAGLIERVTDSAAEVIAEVSGTWVGRFAGPLGQGVTNGVLTLRLGEAATHRCRSLRGRRVGITPWDRRVWRRNVVELSRHVSRAAPSLGRAFGLLGRKVAGKDDDGEGGRGFWGAFKARIKRSEGDPEERFDTPVDPIQDGNK